MYFDVPVLFIVFNRPEATKRVFNEIRKIKPRKLFVAADGPRENIPGERERVKAVKTFVQNGVDWKCDVKTLFRDKNCGCKLAVSSAIDWFFQNVEEGIILEDDCLPDYSFFEYCRVLLERYRYDDRIMHIGGINLQNGYKRGDGSYYFSRFAHIWGWATWRRAWQSYDLKMSSFPDFIAQNQINNVLIKKSSQKFWLKNFRRVYENDLDTWDYQWIYNIWRQSGLAIIPNFNLVSNIGFGLDATHTKGKNIMANRKTEKIESIRHPEFITVNRVADDYYCRSLTFFYRLINKLKVYFGFIND